MTQHRHDSVARAASAHVDSSRLLGAIEALAAFGARSDGGVDRPALSPLDIDARRHLIDRAHALGCTVTTDGCANLFIRRPGTEDIAPVITGSHIDTPTGGKLDGCYGVLAGIECIAALNDACIETHRPLEVAIWTNEEGTRFQPGAMGSSAYVDPALLERYREASDASGATLGHPDDKVLAAFDRQLACCLERHGAALEPLFSHAPVRFDDALVAHLTDTCAALDAPALTLTSGAFHDAMYLARHCPTAMLFVPSRGGISHNPLESTSDYHLVLGTRALAHCLATLCNEP
jgi:acetylornithine deacetylase/succinyl-diaminopimelate desuccinylase-like protein